MRRAAASLILSAVVGGSLSAGVIDFVAAPAYTFSDNATPPGGIRPPIAAGLLLSASEIAPAVFRAPRDQAAQSPYATVIADFNTDARGDVAFVNAYHQSVTVVTSGGPTRTMPVGSLPADLAVADFNADLRRDLVVANAGSNTISVLLGAGDGTFEPALTFGAGLRPTTVAVADFNGDGKHDVAIGNAQSSDVSVLAGNGDGTFGPMQQLPLATAPSAIIAADFNQDLRTDIAVGGAGGITVLRGTGLGTFLPALTTAAPLNLISDFAAADFNRDGRLDLAAADPEGATLRIFSGDGTGGFPASALINTNYKLYSLVLADVNEDSMMDLVAGGWWPCGCDLTGALVFIRKPDGTLQPPTVVLASGDVYSVAVGDLNGDDHLDLVAASLRTLDAGGSPPDAAFPVGTLSIRFGRGDGSFPETPKAGGIADWPRTADFNADGRADLAVVVRSPSSGSTCGIVVALGTEDGTLETLPLLPYPGICGEMAAGDFNGDGRPDLLVTGPEVRAMLGNGDGTFADGPVSPVLTEALSLGIGDFDSDEHLDLAYFGRDSQFNLHLYVQAGNGDGSFDAPVEVILDPRFNLFGLAVADVNGDTHDDIALITGAPTQLSLIHGNGDGTFRLPVGMSTGLNGRDLPSLITQGDVNDDGRADLVVGNYNSGSVSVLLQANGTLQPSVTYFTPYRPRAIAVADVNNDRMSDLVVLNSNTLSLLLGRGDGTVALQQAGFSALQEGREMVVADFTSDGRADVVLTNYHHVDGLALIINMTPAAPALRVSPE